MTAFAYRAGQLCAEEVPLADIAQDVGTPFYCYSSAVLTAQYRALADAFAALPTTICYAVKANGNLAVIRTLAALGAGADVVSEGELRRALRADVPPSRIVFSGVGKTREEMAFALQQGIRQINVESVPELEALSEVASGLGRQAEIAIRVNPDVDARTHAKITTGRQENKFGIDIADARAVYARAGALAGLRPVSVAVHIGSQLTDLAPFRAAFSRVAELVAALRADGHAISRIDLGGGLGIAYRNETPPAPAAYAAMVRETVGHLGCELMLEPGRFIVGNAGVLVARVIYIKDGGDRRFIIVDAAMNDLVRPAMYDAWHGIRPVREPAWSAVLHPVDVVGPVCETSDTFARARALPPLLTGDLLVLDSAGAYGAVMASTYNSRLPVPEVLVSGGDYAVVRARPDYDDLLALESLAPWQAKPGRRGVA